MFSSIRIAIVLTVIALGVAGYYHLKKVESDLETARENVVKLETAVAISEETVSTLQRNIETNAVLSRQLQEDLQRAETYADELRATLQRHNLTHLATQKPGLIEKRMQDATDQLWDDLRAVTDTNGVQLADPGAGSSNSN